MASVLRHHFLKEISGSFVNDSEVNEAVRVLKIDECDDVKYLVEDINTIASTEARETTRDSFMQTLTDIRMNSTARSDTDSSINSEDEQRIENEIKRHNSEDEIDHGPVLSSLR